jgi:hypothetical protein
VRMSVEFLNSPTRVGPAVAGKVLSQWLALHQTGTAARPRQDAQYPPHEVQFEEGGSGLLTETDTSAALSTPSKRFARIAVSRYI